MKYAGWIAGLTIIISLLGVWEVIYQLKGNGAAVEIASVCVFLVWIFLVFKIAKWADREIESAKAGQSGK